MTSYMPFNPKNIDPRDELITRLQAEVEDLKSRKTRSAITKTFTSGLEGKAKEKVSINLSSEYAEDIFEYFENGRWKGAQTKYNYARGADLYIQYLADKNAGENL